MRGLPLDFLNELKLINTNSVCIDLGANIGLISSMMARRGATVYAFEPNPAIYILLEEKYKSFPNIHPIKKAAGITNRSVNLYLHSDNHGENKAELSQASSLKSNKPNVSKENLYPLAHVAINKLDKLANVNKKIPNEIITNLKSLKDPSKIGDNIIAHLNISIPEN